MSIDAHLAELERRHRALEAELNEARAHPSIDDLEIVELKRRKLLVKDEIARLRMERLGLARFFPEGEGAFGCESDDRAELIRIALARAGVPPEDAVEIGDTKVDEETAHAAGIRQIRVDRLGSFAELLELVT